MMDNQENKKTHFELTESEKRGDYGEKLFRIRATMDFTIQGREVKKGDLGGFVSSADCIRGKAWVADNAQVSSGSLVAENALVEGDAKIQFESKIRKNANISGNATIDNSFVAGNASVGDGAIVRGGSLVTGYSKISGVAVVSKGLIANHTRIGSGAILPSNTTLSLSKDSSMITQNRNTDFKDALVEEIAQSRGLPLPYEDENKKESHYRLTGKNKVTEDGVMVYQIEALKDLRFSVGDGIDVVIKNGDKGGYVASADTLGVDTFISENITATTKLPDGIFVDCGRMTINNPASLASALKMTDIRAKSKEQSVASAEKTQSKPVSAKPQ